MPRSPNAKPPQKNANDRHQLHGHPARIHRSPAPLHRPQTTKVALLALVIYAVFVIGCGLVIWTSKDDRRGAIDFIATMAFVLIGVVTLIRLSQKYFLVKRFATESKFLSGIHLTIDDSGLHGVVEGIGESTTQWGALTAWAEGPNVFLLISGFTFRPIPKRVLSPEQQTELLSLLERHIAVTKPT